MAKIIIPFDNKTYDVDESSLSTASAQLKSHLSTVMNGSGATINFDGTSYNVDSAKLSAATSDFISHLGTIAGNGYKVVVNGVEYNIDSTKMSGAIADLHAVLGDLYSGDNDSDGERHDDAIAEGAYYANLATGTFYSQMPATCSDGDTYLCGDYVYQYSSADNGWSVHLATAETGIQNYVPNYPVVDKNGMSYGTILESINNKPIVSIALLFDNCYYLIKATIPNGVTSIGSHAFSGCEKLINITIPDGVTSIGEYAFFCCRDLTKITIPNSVTSIGSSAFGSCESITSIIIPDGVTSIGEYTFLSCYELSSATIPSSVTSIGEYAFGTCGSLTNIVFNGTTAQWNNISKADTWNNEVPATEVKCSDGTVSLI